MTKFEGFETPNTTPVPDVVFDELLEKLTGNELKALLYIIRRTYGFGKNADAISLSQFRKGITTQDGKVLDRGCGIKHNRTILEALESLEKKGYIASRKRTTNAGDSDTTVYKMRFKMASEAQADIEVVTPRNDVVISGNDGSYPASLPSLPHVTTVVTPRNPQETVIQQTDSQETVQQEEGTGAVAPPARAAISDLKEKIEDTAARLKAIQARQEDVEETVKRPAVRVPPETVRGAEPPVQSGGATHPHTHDGASLPLSSPVVSESRAPGAGDGPPPTLTRKQQDKLIEKTIGAYWQVIEAWKGHRYSQAQRGQACHTSGLESMFADGVTPETLKAKLKLLDDFQRRTFTVKKLYLEWWNNLDEQAKPAQNGNRQAPPQQESRPRRRDFSKEYEQGVLS